MGTHGAAGKTELVQFELAVQFDAPVARLAHVIRALDPAGILENGASLDEVLRIADIEIGTEYGGFVRPVMFQAKFQAQGFLGQETAGLYDSVIFCAA